MAFDEMMRKSGPLQPMRACHSFYEGRQSLEPLDSLGENGIFRPVLDRNVAAGTHLFKFCNNPEQIFLVRVPKPRNLNVSLQS